MSSHLIPYYLISPHLTISPSNHGPTGLPRLMRMECTKKKSYQLTAMVCKKITLQCFSWPSYSYSVIILFVFFYPFFPSFFPSYYSLPHVSLPPPSLPSFPSFLPFVPPSHFLVTENGIKGDSTIEKVSKLSPAFVKPHGTHTAANSSFLTDGKPCIFIRYTSLKIPFMVGTR